MNRKTGTIQLKGSLQKIAITALFKGKGPGDGKQQYRELQC